MTLSRSHSTLSPNSILSRIVSSTSLKALYVERSSSMTSTSDRNTVPNDIGITVCERITFSFTNSCARMFSRVGS